MKKFFYLSLGCTGLVLGAAGAVLPVLPSFPFLLLATVSFAKGSERIHRWFTETRLYQQNFAPFAAGDGLPRQTKRRAMLTITATMSFSCFMVREKIWLLLMLAAIWLCLISYLALKVKTKE